MILIIILTIAFIACWIAGGQIKGRIRDIPCPLILALGITLSISATPLHRIFIGIALAACWQIIRLGYGNYNPISDPEPSFLAKITHDRHGWWIRAIYGFLAASIGPIALVVGKHLPIWVWGLYVVGNAAIGYLVSRLRLPVFLTDVCVSTGLVSILFLLLWL